MRIKGNRYTFSPFSHVRPIPNTPRMPPPPCTFVTLKRIRRRKKKGNTEIITTTAILFKVLLYLKSQPPSLSPPSPHPQCPPTTKLLKLQTIPHALPHMLLELGRILPPQPCRIRIRRTLVVRTRQHRDDAQQDGLGRLHGRPALGGGFVAPFVFFGRVQDRDADFAVGVDWQVVCNQYVLYLCGEKRGRGWGSRMTYCLGGRWGFRSASWAGGGGIRVGR